MRFGGFGTLFVLTMGCGVHGPGFDGPNDRETGFGTYDSDGSQAHTDTDTQTDTDTHTDTQTDTDTDTQTDTDTAGPSYDTEVEGDPPVSCQTWSFDGDEGDWTLLNGMSLSSSQESGSVSLTTSSDPYMSASASVDMDACTLIEVVMEVSGSESYGEVFWQSDTDSDFSSDRRMRFELFTDETLVRYVVDLSSHSDWTGHLSRLRLDPHEGDGAVKLQQVRLLDPQGSYPPALDLSDVYWLHTDVSSWPETATLSSVSVDSSQICLDFDKTSEWTAVNIAEGVDVNANPWVFIWRPDLEGEGGQWYGATWEWMRPSTTCKGSYAVAGDHIKQSPFHSTSGWAPSAGETLYFMVSGLARSVERNNEERSNLVEVVWPGSG